MNRREDSPYVSDWLRVARQDWHRIHVMLAEEDGEGAGLFLQQALEKYLKGFLLKHGWKLKKIHTLHSLLDEAMGFDPACCPFELCVNGFPASTLRSGIRAWGERFWKQRKYGGNCLQPGA